VEKFQADALVEAKKQAEVAAEAKATFLATMSHEIRTPMAGMIGMLEMLRLSVLSVDQRHVLQTIEGSARSLQRILDDVLDLSKAEAGRIVLEPSSIHLWSLFDEMLAALAPPIHAKGLSLRVFIAGDVPPRVLVDGGRLRQVLTNLISNATKFTSQGSIGVEVGLITGPSDPLLQIAVSDTGEGMTGEQLARIFSPFVQGDASVARRHGGTGLGLVICRRIVEAMGGAIQVQSEPLAGSCFRFTLPCEKPPRGDDTDGDYPLRGVTVALRVRDELSSVALESILRHCGARVLVGSDQFETVDVIFSDHPDALDRDAARGALILLSDEPMLLAAGEAKSCVSTNPLAMQSVLQAVRHALCLEQGPAGLEQCLDLEVGDITRDEASKRGHLVLVVDDHIVNRELVQRQLRALGCHSDVFSGAEEALSAFKASRYGLVLTDCQMSPMDGYALTRALRAWEIEQELPRCPVIALTAAVTSDPHLWRHCGMDAMLSKPVSLKVLRQVISSHLPGAFRPASEATQESMLGADGFLAALEESVGESGARKLLLLTLETVQSDFEALSAGRLGDLCLELGAWLHHSLGALRVLGNSPLLDEGGNLERRLMDGERSAIWEVGAFLAHLRIYLEDLSSVSAKKRVDEIH